MVSSLVSEDAYIKVHPLLLIILSYAFVQQWACTHSVHVLRAFGC